MTHYILRRLLLSIVVLFGVTIFVAGMLHISGDPVAVILESGIAGNEEREELRRELGLDRPFLIQYLDFVTGAIQGDLGRSLRFRQPALNLVLERLPATVQLAIAAMLFSVAVAVPIGIISAVLIMPGGC
jgi:peptide/nickel transport system permease protein